MAQPDTTLYIVPDENPHSDNDPAFLTETDTASSNQSLSSSIMNYQYENGRRYHAYREGEYIMPNDESEQERLDLHHHISKMALGGELFRAPVDLSSGGRVLDLGTGTGIWAIEIADQFPRATVKGTDLSPIQPQWVPPNCHFEVDDLESSWDYAHKLDFIHARNLAGGVRDYPRLYEYMMANLNPGGWAQSVDFAVDIFTDDDTIQNAPNIKKWIDLLDEGSLKFGKKLNIAHKHKQWMIDAGFKNVTEEVYKVCSSFWLRKSR